VCCRADVLCVFRGCRHVSWSFGCGVTRVAGQTEQRAVTSGRALEFELEVFGKIHSGSYTGIGKFRS
jgi:hypothetical protein